jgi:cyclic pyranopterin phosphate synthase
MNPTVTRMDAEHQVRDTLGRSLKDLRISVVDRCNFRCPYCMPAEVYGDDYAYLPRADWLTPGEICRLARLTMGLGVRKIRLTGGEPLLRRDIAEIVASIAALPGLEDLALTTNGMLLAERAASLRAAGLRRVTVSLDSLDPQVFQTMSGGRGSVAQVLEGMDVGTLNQWRREQVVTSKELLAAISARWPVNPLEQNYRGEVARRYAFADGGGEIGFISSVSEPFCGDCHRARLSADGTIYTCLFATQGTNLRIPLRAGASDAELSALLQNLWRARVDRYSEQRGRAKPQERRIEMYRMGG